MQRFTRCLSSFVLLIFIAPALRAQDDFQSTPRAGYLRGRVVSEMAQAHTFIHEARITKIPIPRALLVVLTDQGQSFYVQTDDDGYFEQYIPATRGRILARFSSAGVVVRSLWWPEFPRIVDRIHSGWVDLQEQPVWLNWDPLISSVHWDLNESSYYEIFLGSAGGDVHLAAATTYYHTMQTQEWVKEVWTDWEPPLMEAFVNNPLSLSGCRASYTMMQNSMFFTQPLMAPADPCPNMAFSTMIRHIVARGILQTTGFGRGSYLVTDFGGFYNGFSDAVATLSLRTPCIGEGFDWPHADKIFQGSGCLRRVDEPDLSAGMDPMKVLDGGIRGLPLAGAFWDLRKAIEETYPSDDSWKVAQTLLLKATLMPHWGLDFTFTAAVLAVDKTTYARKYGDLIVEAFRAHGMWR